jgi:hypothetical protein
MANTTPHRPPGITCEVYEPGDGTRCRHYRTGGGCALPGHLECIEWRKRNPTAAPAAASGDTDLFGRALPPPATRRRTGPPPPAPAGLGRDPDVRDLPALDGSIVPPVAPPCGFGPADVASFQALGVEVCLASEQLGPIWLVSDYTGQARPEISVEHAATVIAVAAAFPGARVAAFRRLASPVGGPTETLA